MGASDADKTEAPTPKRKRDARKEGQIPKTPELGMWLQILVASFGIRLTMERGYHGLHDFAADIERISQSPDPVAAVGLFANGLGIAITAVLPLALLMVVIGVVALASQTGLVLATKAAKPKFSKVNPIAGVKRLFKPQSLWQGAKSLAKLVILASFSWSPVLDISTRILDSGRVGIIPTAGAVVETAVGLMRTVAMVGLVLAIADYAFQRWSVGKSLKMSKKEIQDEHKQSEGDPHVKGQRRRRQQEMTRNRMLSAVGDASVVVVNPTHVAVAIRYEQGHGAPRVVAKGRGHIADRIRAEAAANFVPIVRDIPLARTLEQACRVDQTIPSDLYEAVARLLAFVMQLGRRASLLGGVLENPAAAPLPMPETVPG